MKINIYQEEPPVRENRTKSIVGYDGTLKDLTEQGCKGCLKNKDRGFTTGTYCSHLTSITSVLGLPDTLVVDHAPIGCCGVEMIFNGGYYLHQPLPGGGYLENVRMVTTKFTESDTVFGATDKLRHVVRCAYERHHPKEIYIATSCTSAIIGEDVESVAEEMTEELGIPVTMLGAAGMRSKLWSTGFDAYFHSVGKARFKDPEKKSNKIIYAGFASVAGETLAPILEKLGLELMYLTAGSTIEDFEQASSAVASFGQCDVFGSYVLGYLEQEYGVKHFHVHQPNGGIGFERFMRDLGAYLNKEEIAETIIKEEREKYAEKIDALRPILKGKTGLVALGSGYVFELSRMLKELGMEPIHAVSYHYDPLIDTTSDRMARTPVADVKELKMDYPVTVNNAQEMENYLVIKKYNPDIVLTRAHGAGCWAAKVGVPCLDPGLGINLIGYRGLYLFADGLASSLRNTSVFQKLKERYQSPFTDEFEALPPHSFYKGSGRKRGPGDGSGCGGYGPGDGTGCGGYGPGDGTGCGGYGPGDGTGCGGGLGFRGRRI
ncbi:MAG: oxidoreductase [Parasporobacterium sp.]|nr:oxidoreductase [Parasporobacterium sp.]